MITFQTDSNENYSFEELLACKKVPHDERPAGYQVTNSAAQFRLLERMAYLFRTYGCEMLEDNPYIWKQLRICRDFALQLAEEEKTFLQVQWKAETAWKNQNYATYVEIMAPWKSNLNLLMTKRLEYARKKCGDIKG